MSVPDAASRRCARAAMVDRVVATDISERALWFTQLNALLNGVDGIETRLGSLFVPVAGEEFDRVVSNPPFVITPRVAGVPEYEYRDGGMDGDDLVAAFVREVGGVLAPGGVAQLLGNWETRGGVDGLDRVREWVASSPVPLDAWVIERESLDPLAYAELWVRDGGTLPGTPGFARLVDAWLDDFAVAGCDGGRASGTSCYAARSRDRPTLARYERLPQALPGRRHRGAPRGRARRARPRGADERRRARSIHPRRVTRCDRSPASTPGRRRADDHRTPTGRGFRSRARGRPGLGCARRRV